MSRESFVASIMPYARKWETVTGIPAAVFIAIGASETNWGAAGGFFGIKGASPSGKSTSYKTWEMVEGVPVDTTDTFAVYDTPDEGFQHFISLISQGRYQPAWDAFKATGDWRTLLQGLNTAGYATDLQWFAKIASLAGDINGGVMPESIDGDTIAATAIRDWQVAEKAWREYQRTNRASADADGNVFILGPDGKQKLDAKGKQVYQAYTSARQQVDDAIAIREVLGTGADAAKAYQESEILKVKEADRAYADWTKRITDLNKLEALPGAAAEEATQTRLALEKVNNERVMAARSGIALPLSGRIFPTYDKTPAEVRAENYAPYADSLRSTISKEAPQFLPLSAAATAPIPTGIGNSITFSPSDIPQVGQNDGGTGLGLPELDIMEQAKSAPGIPSGYANNSVLPLYNPANTQSTGDTSQRMENPGGYAALFRLLSDQDYFKAEAGRTPADLKRLANKYRRGLSAAYQAPRTFLEKVTGE